MKAIEVCRSCKKADLSLFCDLGNQPFANSLLRSSDDPENYYPLRLVFCQHCGLVQLMDTADPAELFSHYVWVTNTSSTAKEQSNVFCEHVLTHLPHAKVDRYVLEVASNDGTFLKPFIQKGISVLGVDPAANIVQQAVADSVPSLCAFFGKETARNILEEKGRPDVVFARNVLAHVANLHDFVQGIEVLVKEDGLAVVEFHYAKYILSGLQYDSIYHEHLCYFSLKSVSALFLQYGFQVVDVDESPISGGALIVYFRKNAKSISEKVTTYLAEEERQGVNNFESWKQFGLDVYQHREKLSTLLDKTISAGKKVVGYGASARSSTLLNFCDIKSDRLSMIADQNSLKNGLYTAGTHIPVLSPHEVMNALPDVILILAWNFLDEIVDYLSSQLGFHGEIIIPLPKEPVVKTI